MHEVQSNGEHYCVTMVRIVGATDLSTARGFVDLTEREQIEQSLLRQGAFVSSLAQAGGGRSLSLRFLSGSGQVQVCFMLRTKSQSRLSARRLCEEFWTDFLALFPHELYAQEPVTDRGSFFDLYQPFGQATVLGLEVVKYEELRSPVVADDTDYFYLVYPFDRDNQRSMSPFWQTLRQNPARHVVNICLEPCVFSDADRDFLGQIASHLRFKADPRQWQGASRMWDIPRDENAALAADLYGALATYPSACFRFRMQVLSTGIPAQSVVSSLAGNISARYSLASPRSQDEQQIADDTFYLGEVGPPWGTDDIWDRDDAPTQLRHLSQIVSPTEAIALLQLPIPPRDGITGLPLHQATFRVRERADKRGERPFVLGNTEDGAEHTIELATLTRHTLLAGTTGSGKTNTALQLLTALWRTYRVPFLVLEPVNAEQDEYRSLLAPEAVGEDLRVYTAGDEGAVPFRFNPFDVPRGTPVGAHVANLLQCFLAALPLGGPLPFIFRSALINIYRASGWADSDKGGDSAAPAPTMSDFYEEVAYYVEHKLEHKGETRANIIGASKLRVAALLDSPFGRIVNGAGAIPIDQLLASPTILELRHLGSDEDRALLMGFVLIALQEYCDVNRSGDGSLQHVTVVEEAHTLLSARGEAGDPDVATTREQAVSTFVKLLSEMRKYGEGIVLIDQIPTRLAEDAIKNTNLKFMHRLPAQDDRQIMGASMHFDEQHARHAIDLQIGEAVVYHDGLREPVLLRVPEFLRSCKPDSDALREHMRRHSPNDLHEHSLPFDECSFCEAQCQFRSLGSTASLNRRLCRDVAELARTVEPEHAEVGLRALIGRCRSEAAESPAAAAYCIFVHLRREVPLLEVVSPLAMSRLIDWEVRRGQSR